MDPIAPGRVLNGKWTLGAVLGTGGSGMVYEASHRNGIRAAVKILHPKLAADPDQVARFLREGAIANHLEHVGVVAALDDDRTEDGLLYVVFERIDGMSLADILEARAPLSVVEALTLTDKILDVLAEAHAKGIVHRDVKPGNVLVLPSGEVKLLDFGLAKTDRLTSDHAPSPTQSGAIFGTLGFMPPEQASGQTERIDERSDLWAVAAVLFTMLTRQRLHASERPAEALQRASLEAAPPIRSVRSSVPDVVARIVDRGLARARDERFQSAVRMQGAVRFALSSVVPQATSPGSSTTSEPRPPPRAARRRTGVALALGLVGLAALAGFAWLASAAAEPGPRGNLDPSGHSR